MSEREESLKRTIAGELQSAKRSFQVTGGSAKSAESQMLEIVVSQAALMEKLMERWEKVEQELGAILRRVDDIENRMTRTEVNFAGMLSEATLPTECKNLVKGKGTE